MSTPNKVSATGALYCSPESLNAVRALQVPVLRQQVLRRAAALGVRVLEDSWADGTSRGLGFYVLSVEARCVPLDSAETTACAQAQPA